MDGRTDGRFTAGPLGLFGSRWPTSRPQMEQVKMDGFGFGFAALLLLLLRWTCMNCDVTVVGNNNCCIGGALRSSQNARGPSINHTACL